LVRTLRDYRLMTGHQNTSKNQIVNSTPGLASLQNLFEMAWCLSRTHQNELVLCKDFLPWTDIAVSAKTVRMAGLSTPGFDPEAVQARWRDAANFVGHCNEAKRHSLVWAMASLSLGHMRCWPTSLRDQAIEVYGPFRVTIESVNLLEQWV
jgi:hypothetical protein